MTHGRGICLIALLVASTAVGVLAADRPQWGQAWTRNQASPETGLPDAFEPPEIDKQTGQPVPGTGRNIRWTARLGSEAWSTPVVAGGRVYIGTNNEFPRDPRHEGDRGVLLCLDEKDGRLLWQLVVPKLVPPTGRDPYLDWPKAGICSPPVVEGDRVYIVTNRVQIVCLDVHGLANGNDGPFQDEARHQTPAGQDPVPAGPTDADIIWTFDVLSGAGTYPHDSAHAAVMLDGDFLYSNTCNGVDNTHKQIRKPDAPSLIALEKATGRLVGKDAERIGPRIFHSTWSSPAMGEAGGRRLVIFGGGDGVVYAFEPLKNMPPQGAVESFKRIWKFDCDPAGPKENVSEYLRNRKESPSNIKGMPVIEGGRVYVAAGGDIWWGKNEASLKCIDASGSGDITSSALVWSYPVNPHCCSTPAVAGALVFITDCGRMVHCLDARTGQPHWTQETQGEMWSSPLVADGKVYVATRRGEFWIFAADKEKRVLHKTSLSPIAGTPVAANGRLYVNTMTHLYCIGTETGAAKPKARASE